jgi:hypothetical protein
MGYLGKMWVQWDIKQYGFGVCLKMVYSPKFQLHRGHDDYPGDLGVPIGSLFTEQAMHVRMHTG